MSKKNAPTVTVDPNTTYRPEQIADKLGVSGKLVRSFLRANFTRPIEAKGTTWVLTADQAKTTAEHFLARRSNTNVPAGNNSGGGSPANEAQ